MKRLEDRYLSTFTGKKFFPFNPAPDQIDIRDIAHGLSLLCRFSGQAPFFYSVAEHSIYIAHNLPPHLQLEGLLHDASVSAVIAQKFGLFVSTLPEIKAADRALLKHEVFAFFGPERYLEDFGDEYQPTNPKHFFGMSPATAEAKFLELYHSLTSTSVL